jgi:hypothetical protein
LLISFDDFLEHLFALVIQVLLNFFSASRFRLDLPAKLINLFFVFQVSLSQLYLKVFSLRPKLSNLPVQFVAFVLQVLGLVHQFCLVQQARVAGVGRALAR